MTEANSKLDRAEVERRLVRLNRWSYLTLAIIFFGWMPLLAASNAHELLATILGTVAYAVVLMIHVMLSSAWWRNYEDIRGRL